MGATKPKAPPPELLQKWRRRAITKHWLYVLAKELARRRGALEIVDNEPEAAWLKLRAAWEDIEASWDYIGIEEDGKGGAQKIVNDILRCHGDVAGRVRPAAGRNEQRRRKAGGRKGSGADAAAHMPGTVDSASIEDPPQERKAALGPPPGSIMQRARELQRTAVATLLDAQRRAASVVGAARIHFAEQMKQEGHVVAQMALGGSLIKSPPRVSAKAVFSGRMGRMPRAIMMYP